jgi:hypothetical protein
VTSVALTLGLLLAFLTALLAVPSTIVFSVHRTKETRGTVRFSWLFGLVRFKVRMPRPAKSRKRPAPAPVMKPKPPRPRKKKWRAGGMVSLIRERAFRQRVHKFVQDILRATHARNLFLRLRIGLDDPADTGRLWAAIGPIAGVLQNLRVADVRIVPDFMDAALEVESHGRFRLVPIQFIALTAAFVLSPTMLRAWWRIYRGDA